MPDSWLQWPEEGPNCYKNEVRAEKWPAAGSLTREQQRQRDAQHLAEFQGLRQQHSWEPPQPGMAAPFGRPPGTLSRAQVSSGLQGDMQEHYVVLKPFRGGSQQDSGPSSDTKSTGQGSRATRSNLQKAPRAVRAFLACSEELRLGPAQGLLGKVEASALGMLLVAGQHKTAPAELRACSDVIINHICDQREAGMACDYLLMHGCVSAGGGAQKA